MVLKKLKFLLKPPTLLLFGNGVLFGALLWASRMSSWGTAAFILYALYLYTARVRGRGFMGWTLLALFLISYVAVTGLVSEEARIAALISAAVLALFLSAIEYRVKNLATALKVCDYTIVGIGSMWWMNRAAISGWIIVPIASFFVIYALVRDQIRFVEHEWTKESKLWYMIFAYISAGYLWGLSLLPLAAVQTTALFLIFFIIADEMIAYARTNTLNTRTALVNAAWYAGSSAAIIFIGQVL